MPPPMSTQKSATPVSPRIVPKYVRTMVRSDVSVRWLCASPMEHTAAALRNPMIAIRETEVMAPN